MHWTQNLSMSHKMLQCNECIFSLLSFIILRASLSIMYICKYKYVVKLHRSMRLFFLFLYQSYYSLWMEWWFWLMKSEKRWDLIVLLVRDMVLVLIPSRREGPWATNHFQVRRRSVLDTYILYDTVQPSSAYVELQNHLLIIHHPTTEWFTQAHDDRAQMSDKWLNINPFPRLQKTYMSRRIWRPCKERRLNYRHASLRHTTQRWVVVVVGGG